MAEFDTYEIDCKDDKIKKQVGIFAYRLQISKHFRFYIVLPLDEHGNVMNKGIRTSEAKRRSDRGNYDNNGQTCIVTDEYDAKLNSTKKFFKIE